MMFYGSALLLRQSPEELYDLDRQAAAQQAGTGLQISANDLDFLPFPYPAVVAAAFVPLTLLGYNAAYYVVLLINLGLLAVSLCILSVRLNLDNSGNQVLILCATASIAVYASLLHGQVSVFLLLLSVLAVTDLRNGCDRSGIWAGFLAFKPTVLPVWLFWFAVQRRWRALLYALGASASIAAISVPLVGVEGTLGYVRMSQQGFRGDFYTMLPHDMPTLKALTRFLGFSDVTWLTAVGFLLLVLWKSSASSPWQYCGLVVAVILAAPHMHAQDMVLLLIVVALVISHAGVSASAVRWSLFGLIFLQSLARILFAGFEGTHWPVMPVILSALFVYFVYRSRAGTRHPAAISREESCRSV